MIPMELLTLEENIRDDAEDDKRYDLLYNLQLHQRERTTVADESDTIGRHQEAVLDAGNCPRKENNDIERPVGRYSGLVKLQMAIPCKCHEDIAGNQ